MSAPDTRPETRAELKHGEQDGVRWVSTGKDMLTVEGLDFPVAVTARPCWQCGKPALYWSVQSFMKCPRCRYDAQPDATEVELDNIKAWCQDARDTGEYEQAVTLIEAVLSSHSAKDLGRPRTWVMDAVGGLRELDVPDAVEALWEIRKLTVGERGPLMRDRLQEIQHIVDDALSTQDPNAGGEDDVD